MANLHILKTVRTGAKEIVNIDVFSEIQRFYGCISISEAVSPSEESKDSLNEEKTIGSETWTPAGDDLPDSTRSSSSNSLGSPPGHTAESDDLAPAPEQEHPPERRFSQTLMEDLCTQLPAPKPVHSLLHEASTSTGESSASHSPRPASPPISLPRALREIAALSSLPSHALPLLEMGFSRRHVIQAMMATGIRHTADARRTNMLVTWLLEHPGSDDGVSPYL